MISNAVCAPMLFSGCFLRIGSILDTRTKNAGAKLEFTAIALTPVGDGASGRTCFAKISKRPERRSGLSDERHGDDA